MLNLVLSTLWTVRSFFSGLEVRLKAGCPNTKSDRSQSLLCLSPKLNGSLPQAVCLSMTTVMHTQTGVRLSVYDHLMHAYLVTLLK